MKDFSPHHENPHCDQTINLLVSHYDTSSILDTVLLEPAHILPKDIPLGEEGGYNRSPMITQTHTHTHQKKGEERERGKKKN